MKPNSTCNFAFKYFVLLVCLVIISITTSCSKRMPDAEVSKLLRSLPSPDSYPDADIVYLLDEAIEEVSSDGSFTSTVHSVILVTSEYGKNYAEQEIYYNSRIETISLLYARTITPEGDVIPLNEHVTKIVDSHSNFPEYSDQKELRFSFPGVEIGSIIDFMYIRKTDAIIKGEFCSDRIFQCYNPVLLSRYKISIPDDMDIKYRMLNPIKDVRQSPIVVRKKGKKTFSWEYKNLQQILYADLGIGHSAWRS